MSVSTITQIRLIGETCIECGQVFGLSDTVRDQLIENHKTFCCPSGQKQHFSGKTQLQLAQEQLERERLWTQRQRERADAAEKDALAQRRAKTRIKNDRDRIKTRVANGVCPCCNRSFCNLAKHMKGQHPDYISAETVND